MIAPALSVWIGKNVEKLHRLDALLTEALVIKHFNGILK